MLLCLLISVVNIFQISYLHWSVKYSRWSTALPLTAMLPGRVCLCICLLGALLSSSVRDTAKCIGIPFVKHIGAATHQRHSVVAWRKEQGLLHLVCCDLALYTADETPVCFLVDSLKYRKTWAGLLKHLPMLHF